MASRIAEADADGYAALERLVYSFCVVEMNGKRELSSTRISDTKQTKGTASHMHNIDIQQKSDTKDDVRITSQARGSCRSVSENPPVSK